jgi:hypothetical protein
MPAAAVLTAMAEKYVQNAQSLGGWVSQDNPPVCGFRRERDVDVTLLI